MKKCTKCKQEKPLVEFHKESKKKRGVSSHCKECRSKQRKTNEARNQPSYMKRWADGIMNGLNLDGRDY
jgi:hypothetical protein